MSLLETLPSAPRPEPASLRALRAEAYALLRTEGLPTRKSEAWRFTNVSELTTDAPGPGPSTLRVGTLPAGVHRVQGATSSLIGGPFGALNAALTDKQESFRVEGALRDPLVFRYDGCTAASYPRAGLTLARNARATLIEIFEGTSAITNAVMEIHLERGAHLHHVRLQQDAGRLVGLVHVEQAAASRYGAHLVTLGGRLQRVDLEVALNGEGAECDLHGVYAVSGEEQVDHHVRVDHRAPRGTSRQQFHGLADGKGVTVFDGKAIVHRTGGGAEAHQQNRNLLLSDRASVHTKPHLEIDHDDVIASHGATVGAIDADALFYLRCRGIPEEQARSLLVRAFVSEPLADVPMAARSWVAKALTGYLGSDFGPDGELAVLLDEDMPGARP